MMRFFIYFMVGAFTFVGAAKLFPPAPQAVTYRYVDERGRAVSEDLARAYFVEQERQDTLARDAELYRPPTHLPASPTPSTHTDISSDKRPLIAPDDGLRATGPRKEYVNVGGYYRRDGTYVRPHKRSVANKTETDNWSSRGNKNPFTGESGTRKARR